MQNELQVFQTEDKPLKTPLTLDKWWQQWRDDNDYITRFSSQVEPGIVLVVK
jgi:hypothetical protein